MEGLTIIILAAALIISIICAVSYANEMHKWRDESATLARKCRVCKDLIGRMRNEINRYAVDLQYYKSGTITPDEVAGRMEKFLQIKMEGEGDRQNN